MNPSDVKRTFRRHGLSPKKWMGQNLLVDPLFLNRIVAAADIEADRPVVEVGAGLGVLTEALAGAGAYVYALEIDSGFYRVLEEKFAGAERIETVHADALKFDFRALSQRFGKLKVVANLPYNISSRLMFRFFEDRECFSSLNILLQREVAERLQADPGSKDYGVLTVLLGVSATVRILFHIPGRAFYPAPDVTSSFVKITFPDEPPVAVDDYALLARLVKASFSGRRKTLRNSLRSDRTFGAQWEKVEDCAAAVNIDPARRAETLSPQEFAAFANALAEIT